MTRARDRPRIKLSRITNTASRIQSFPGWTGSHPRRTWATAISPAMSGCTVPRSLDPPPPPPKINVILIIGNLNEIKPLGDQLAKALGQDYVHINLHSWLRRTLDHYQSDKREALGLLHPSVAKAVVQHEHTLTPRSVADILLRCIGIHTWRGRRNFVVTGFVNTQQTWRFKCDVAEPNAVLVLESLPKESREELGVMFGESKTVSVPVDQGDLRMATLRALGERAGLVKARVDEEELNREKAKRNDLVAMVANAALRSPENGVSQKDTPMQQDHKMEDCDVAMDSLETWCNT